MTTLAFGLGKPSPGQKQNLQILICIVIRPNIEDNANGTKYWNTVIKQTFSNKEKKTYSVDLKASAGIIIQNNVQCEWKE